MMPATQCSSVEMRRVHTRLACTAVVLLIATPAAAGSGASGLRDELRLGDLEFSMDSRTSDNTLAEQPANLGATWNNLFSLTGTLDKNAPLSLNFDVKLIDRRRLEGQELDSARLGSFDAWERRTVGDANLKFGFLDNRLRFTSRVGWSRSMESPDPKTLMAANFASLSEMEGDGGKMDVAFLQRLDATLWRSDQFKVTAFGSWGRVGQEFRTAGKSDAGKKDFFDRPNLSLLRGGAKFRAGPMRLALSHSIYTHDIHLEPEEQRGNSVNKAEVEFSLDEVAHLLGQESQKGVFRWLPSSVTVSGAMGVLEPYADAEIEDAVTDTSVGMWWYRDNWSAGGTLWRSLWDSRQTYAEDADWLSTGADVSFSFYGERWDVSATAGVGRYLNQEEVTRSGELSLQGSVTLGLRPESLPDLTGTLSVNRSSTDYIAYQTASLDQYWEVSTALDFSKYLPQNGSQRPHLKLIYSFSRWSGDDGFSDLAQTQDHAVLLNLGFAF